jgi:hypothetical protein
MGAIPVVTVKLIGPFWINIYIDKQVGITFHILKNRR